MYLNTLLIFSFVFCLSSVKADPSRVHYKNVANKIKRTIDRSRIPKNELGIWIGESLVGAGNFFELNSEKLFIPASLTKIITGYASFKTFTLEHKFKTELYTQGKISKEVLEGDLYLKGGGDPSFVSQSMWQLVNEFVRSGIKEVRGNIVVDDTYFDNIRYDNSREDRRVDRAYDAPVGAMSFNWNSINVYVRPAKKLGKKAKVFADPESPYIEVVNKTKTVPGKVKKIKVSRVANGQNGDKVIVAGSIGINKEEIVSYKSITRPELWSAVQLREFLKQRGIKIHGEIKTGKLPEGAILQADLDSSDMRQIVTDMMKFSNNYVAEMLTKNISAHKTGKPGSIASGISQIRNILEDNIGFDPKFYNLINPSGLTRRNKFRPMDLAKLLNSAKSDFHFFPEFIASMPISGVDGTLKERFSEDVDLKVRAKTGLLNGVTALAGYLEQPNGTVLTFVLVFNGTHGRINKAAILFENLIKDLSFDKFVGKNI